MIQLQDFSKLGKSTDSEEFWERENKCIKLYIFVSFILLLVTYINYFYDIHIYLCETEKL